MNFLANENFPVNSIRLLRNVGHNVASIIEDTPGVRDYAVIKDREYLVYYILRIGIMQTHKKQIRIIM